MKQILLLISLFFAAKCFAQKYPDNTERHWEFSKAGTDKWYPAIVPGNIYSDLFRNKLIPDPFFSDNEKNLRWVDSCDWVYRCIFNVHDVRYGYMSCNKYIDILFRGLDTYADVYINGSFYFKADNMFRQWREKSWAKEGKNEVKVYFHSAQKMVDSLAKKQLPAFLPDNNRVYARKAQYQFGWDWGPKYIGCGIWKQAGIFITNGVNEDRELDQLIIYDGPGNRVKLVQQKDSIGQSFYFEKDGKPVYIKGANWIPANIFPSAVTHDDYRRLLIRAKDAHMNMLRVWGGGIYEDDYFYDLCDSLDIMVWQDFMFAGGMYPADETFLKNVKKEVKYQVDRLKYHPCIVLWCGNNEIDEAWHNWGWQDQYNIHGADSAKLWQNYKTLFEDSLKAWVNEFDGWRPYIPSSPKYGWGDEKSFTEGDSHYWGVWWGLEPWESFENHTGRFVSEYGMQAMPNYETVKSYVPANDLNYSSPAVQWHQKANEGFYKLNFYLDKYFMDSAKLKKLSLEEYTYLTQCLQYYILKNSIAVQRSKKPYNMGTMVWQLDDCWPATSWSITDYSRDPKAGYYAIKEAYRDDIKQETDRIYPKNEKLQKPVFWLHSMGDSGFSIESSVDAKYVYIVPATPEDVFSNNYFDLKAGEQKLITVSSRYLRGPLDGQFKIISLYDILLK